MTFPSRHYALRTSVRLTLATLALSSFSVHAEEALDTVTVTANRMPTEHALAPTTVITRADIDRLQINDLPSLLSRQPGIDVAVSGGLGKDSSIFMRGTNSGHVLVLVDGVKWQSATSGKSAIQHFPVEQIERIEIVRGSRSGLYGAEAIGGVIQIFTRKGHKGEITPYFKAGLGNHNSNKVAAGVSGGNDNTTYNISVNHEETDGINVSDSPKNNPDKDGYRNKSIAASVQHHLTDKVDIGANFMRAEGFNEYDSGKITDEATGETVEQVIGANSKIQLTDTWLVSVNLGESRDQSHSFKNGLADGTYSTRHRFANLTNTVVLTPEHTINLGFDYNVDDVTSTKKFTETSRDNKAVFASWQGNMGKQSWLVAARHDDNEAFGGFDTGTAEWGVWLNEGIQLTANIGTAFKAPTFNSLYYPFTSSRWGIYQGNPNLQPEKSRNYGLGLNIDSNVGFWTVQAYKNDIRDLISASGRTMPVNVENAKIEGVEFGVTSNILNWDLSANASFLKPEDEKTGNILARRAQRLANIMLDKAWGDLSAGASWKLRGDSYNDAANKTKLGGYGLLDLRMAYAMTPEWSLQANLSNVFDKEYQTAKGYNSLDRTVMFTVSYQP